MAKLDLRQRELKLLVALAAVQFTHIVDFMIMMPMGQLLMRLFEISPHQFSFLVSAYSLSAGLSGFLGTFWMDRFDRKNSLLVVYFCFAMGTLACALAPNYPMLLIARLAAGAFGGIMGTLVLAIVGDTIPEERRGSAMGIVMASFSVASVLGVPLGLWLSTKYSWHAPFLALAGISLGFLAMAKYVVPNVRNHLASASSRRSPGMVLYDVFSDRSQVQALIFTILLVFGHFTVVPFLSASMVANVGFAEDQLTYIYFVGGLLTIFTSPMIGRFSDRFGKREVFSVLVACAAVPIFFITHMGRTNLVLALTATAAFFVCSGGRFIPAMAMITTIPPEERRGSFMSLNTCVQQLASGLAAYAAGLIIVRAPDGQLLNYPLVGYLAVACSFFCVLMMRVLVPRFADSHS